MKACVLHEVGKLVYEDVAMPVCGADEVLVKIINCGVCGSDIGRVFKTGTYHFPTIIGHEFAGLVVADESGEWLNKRVAVFPLLPCFDCDMCSTEHYAQCRNYDYYGSRRDGGFAEYIAVKRWNLLELPQNVSFVEGAMCEPTSVALRAIKSLNPSSNDELLVTGAGPIGMIVGFWAKSRGVKNVYYIDLDEGKIDLAKSFGFHKYEGQRVTCCIEGTGASSAIATAINAVDPFGKIILMGNPGREVTLSAKDYQNILRKELTLVGTWNSMYGKESDWKDSLIAMSEGKLPLKKLITHTPSLAQAFDTLKMMADRTEFYCKVVIDNEK